MNQNQEYISLSKRVSVLEHLLKDGGLSEPLAVPDENKDKTFKLSSRSYKRMQGIHPDLVKVVERAIQITPFDFAITEGLRTAERQAALRKRGASHVKVSKHQSGLAFDIVVFIDGEVNWDFPNYRKVSGAFMTAAKELKVGNLFWGGNWPTLRDGPHFQLDNTESYA